MPYTNSQNVYDSLTFLAFSQWKETQDNLNLQLARQAYGMHMPIRMMMNRQIATQVRYITCLNGVYTYCIKFTNKSISAYAQLFVNRQLACFGRVDWKRRNDRF